MMKYLSVFIFVIMLIGCSSNTANNRIGKQQTVETGTVLSMRTFNIKPEQINSYGNVGVGIGSGGYRGIFGSVDIGTLARLFRNATGPKVVQEIIIRKSNGEAVAITQVATDNFKTGDAVKILLKNGEARVIHL
jgi:outer membrane lipoprotein SlyB